MTLQLLLLLLVVADRFSPDSRLLDAFWQQNLKGFLSTRVACGVLVDH
jgi:hypothetical protein